MTQSVPKRFEDSDFALLPKELQDAVNATRETRKGIYLWGPVGSGKTYAAYAIRKHVEEEMKLHVRLYSAPDMFEMIKDDYAHRDSFNLERILDFKGLLIIDDLGAEKASEWVSATFFRIINKRYELVLPTIITSNLDLGELSDRIGDRVPSRIAEMCDIIKLEGDDRRVKT